MLDINAVQHTRVRADRAEFIDGSRDRHWRYARHASSCRDNPASATAFRK